ncbi:MAG: RIP metalloprotease RseP [Pseudomonadota bacterium]|nr:RIP metalloprotease RseP [Pseudomonadota bacterium]
MDAIQNSISWVFSNTVPFVVLLGLLIFVHELGHFLVAKYFKVRVEVFSMGFGKKLFQYKYGDTVYCLSLIPLGGYIKLFGDDPRVEISPELKKISFLHKPLGQRIAVVLAGPLMNFFFAIFLFAAVGLLGEHSLYPFLGDIDPKSSAFEAGFRSGDKVVRVNAKEVLAWKQFNDIIEGNAGNELRVEVARASGENSLVQIKPELKESRDLLSLRSKVGTVDGLTNLSQSSAIGVPNNNSPAFSLGLRSHDIFTHINGKEVTNWREVSAAFEQGLSGAEIEFSLDRYPQSLENPEHLKFKWSVTRNTNVSTFGIEPGELYLFRVVEGSPAEKAGIKANDRLSAINSVKVLRWMDILGLVKSYQEGQPPIKVSLLRNGEPLDFLVTPLSSELPGAQGQQEKRYTIGISPTPMLDSVPNFFWLKTPSLGAAVVYGWEQSILWTQTTFLVFAKIFQAKISPRNIGGIISIHQAAKKTYDFGISLFVKMMGILSINLFVMNLLPIPVLDGGHLFFYLIEAIKGTPVSLRKMEIATQVGLFILVGLMVFALFNDLSLVFKLNW